MVVGYIFLVWVTGVLGRLKLVFPHSVLFIRLTIVCTTFFLVWHFASHIWRQLGRQIKTECPEIDVDLMKNDKRLSRSYCQLKCDECRINDRASNLQSSLFLIQSILIMRGVKFFELHVNKTYTSYPYCVKMSLNTRNAVFLYYQL